MAYDTEGLLRSLLASPQGAKIIGNMDKLKSFVESAEGKALLTQLSAGGGEALKTAATAAISGDNDSSAKLVSSLMSTPDGAKLALSLAQILK